MSRLGIFDTHAHLDTPHFDEDRGALLAQIGEDLEGVINPGCDEISSRFAVELAEKHDFMYAAVGWHPGDVKGIKDDSYLEQLAKWAVHPKVVAIGEIGLDYYWKDNAPRDVQLLRLRQQVDLAKEYNLPIIVHDREAHGDIMDFFREEQDKVKAVFHCYSGSLEMAKELIKWGYYLGFGGTATYKTAEKVREILAYVPVEHLLFETDAPYLTPVPHRGKRNNPLYTELVVQKAAELKGISFEEMAVQSTKNTKELFKKVK